MADALYPSPEDEPGREQSFARLLTIIGTSDSCAGTFLPSKGGASGLAWDRWLELWFRPLLAPAILRAYRHGLRGEVLELSELDREVDAALSPPLAKRSIAAAAPFFLGKSGIRACRAWSRYHEMVERAESPGHLALVFAFHAALFRVPLVQTLMSYGQLEFEKGVPAGGAALSPERKDGVFSRLHAEVKLALDSEIGHGQGTLLEDPGPSFEVV